MTYILDNAIKHYTERTENLKKDLQSLKEKKALLESNPRNPIGIYDEPIGTCTALVQEYDQLVRWLTELKQIREQSNEGKWEVVPTYCCQYPIDDACAKGKHFANDEWCLTCEYWRPDGVRYKCRKCGKTYDVNHNFCPNCGSDNRSDD